VAYSAITGTIDLSHQLRKTRHACAAKALFGEELANFCLAAPPQNFTALNWARFFGNGRGRNLKCRIHNLKVNEAFESN